MSVDAELQPILDLIAATDQVSPMEAGPSAMRSMFAVMCEALGSGPQDVDVVDRTVDGRDGTIPVRVYRPQALSSDEVSPALLFLHGGGFVIGSVATHDALCRSLAVGAGIVVVSVEYRLAPEHPAPAAVDDVDDVLTALQRDAGDFGVDPDRIAVGGDSAGGNLAAIAAIHHRDRRSTDPTLPALRLQLLIYPVVDLTGDTERFPSLRENGEGYFLTRATMEFFAHHYLSASSIAATSLKVSPVRAGDLSGVAPAFVLTAELDPLRDEGEAYAARLRDAGVEVTLERYSGAIHGFVQMGSVAAVGRRAVGDCSAALRHC